MRTVRLGNQSSGVLHRFYLSPGGAARSRRRTAVPITCIMDGQGTTQPDAHSGRAAASGKGGTTAGYNGGNANVLRRPPERYNLTAHYPGENWYSALKMAKCLDGQ